MKAVLHHPETGQLVVDEVPPPALRPEGVLVRVKRSVVGLGPDRSLRGLSQEGALGAKRSATGLLKRMLGTVERGARSRYQTARDLTQVPLPLGYSCSGEVVAVGSDVEELRVGDRVACYGLHFATHAEVNYVPRNLVARMPDRVSYDAAAFVAIGAMAMQGARLAELQLGDRVVIMGAGLVGQVLAQLARCSGATVLVADPDAERCELARKLGAHAIASSWRELESAARPFTDGQGADAVVLCGASGSSELLRIAAACARPKGRLVLLGDAAANLDRAPDFDRELELVVSRSFGAGHGHEAYELGGQDYPLASVRWTERRNAAAFLDLVARGDVDVEALVSRRLPLERAEEAFRAVSEGTDALAAVLEYQPPRPEDRVRSALRLGGRPEERARPDVLQVGAIGAGSFAKSVLLPAFAASPDVRLRAFCTSSGVTSKSLAERYGASFCTSSPEDVLASDEVNTVVVTARHDQHAPLALGALRAGKAVFVERPLCIRAEDLAAFAKLARDRELPLMVGHSRRFAPLARQLRAFFAETHDPLHVLYRVSAPPVPPDSWVHDPELGGGRILAEVSQYVDLFCYLTDSLPARIHADPVPVPGAPHPHRESVRVTLRMQDESVCDLVFLTNGDPAGPGERVEVSGGGARAVLDNFRSLTLHRDGRQRSKKLVSQQKGFTDEVAAFVKAVRGGGAMPIPVETQLAVSHTGFLIRESLERGQPVEFTSPAARLPIL